MKEFDKILCDTLSILESTLYQEQKISRFDFHSATNPYEILDTDESSIIVIDSVGVKKSDIKVEITKKNNKEYILVYGCTNNNCFETEYSVEGLFSIEPKEVEKIEWTTEDGLLSITVFWKKSESENIKIEVK